MRALQMCDRILAYASRTTIIAAGLLLSVLAIATTLDVIARLTMNSGVSGVVEFSELAMIPLVFLAFGWNERTNSHISVDIVAQFTSPRTQAIIFAVSRFVAIAALIVLTWATTQAALETFASKQTHYNAQALVYWPFHFAVPLGFGLLTLEVFFSHMRTLLDRSHDETAPLDPASAPSIGEAGVR